MRSLPGTTLTGEPAECDSCHILTPIESKRMAAAERFPRRQIAMSCEPAVESVMMLTTGRVAEQADASDLKSEVQKWAYEFESRLDQ